jgi:hypothetical protein
MFVPNSSQILKINFKKRISHHIFSDFLEEKKLQDFERKIEKHFATFTISF